MKLDTPTKLNKTKAIKIFLLMLLRDEKPITISLNQLAVKLGITNRGCCYLVNKLESLGLLHVDKKSQLPNTYSLNIDNNTLQLMRTIVPAHLT